MSITIELAAEAEKRLRQRASQQGLPLEEYVREIIAKDAAQANEAASLKQPLAGRFAHLGLSVSREAIDEGRRELWANFPPGFAEAVRRMINILADTHSAVWYLFDTTQLSAAAFKALSDTENAGGNILISAITLVEVRYLTERASWMPPYGAERHEAE